MLDDFQHRGGQCEYDKVEGREFTGCGSKTEDARARGLSSSWAVDRRYRSSARGEQVVAGVEMLVKNPPEMLDEIGREAVQLIAAERRS